MIKNKLIYWGGTLILLVSLVVFSLYNRYSKKTPDAKKFIGKIKEQNKLGFDSLQQAINYENDLDYRIKESINAGDFKTAYSLIDSLPAFGKTHAVHLYKGMIYTRREKYPEAIKEYTQALNDLPFSKARGMRAATYLKMNMLDSAMYDYKKAYSLNYEYSLQIAATFELMNKKDSAQKYYQIYLEHYPSDKAVQEKVKLLTSQ